MKITKREVKNRINSAIQVAPANCHVFVSAAYARHFNKVPNDGRTYVIEDPNKPGVHHHTNPDGSYFRTEKAVYPKAIPELNLTLFEIKVKGKVKKKVHKPRIAEAMTTTTQATGPSDLPPVICLIDINRVIRICGFKKSFIYDQVDFPKPVRLGTSRRSAVRWIESEVIRWVHELAGKR